MENSDILKPGVYPWRVEIRLKFPGIPRKRKIGFRYEWKAWLLAYDTLGVDIQEFGEMDPDKQITAIHYGAAVWDRMTKGRNVYFTYDDMVTALSKASKEDNILLADTMGNAQFPEWMKNLEGNKKKAEK